jgi:hypothetical protein
VLDLSTLESHADPQVRALVRELRAARELIAASMPLFDRDEEPGEYHQAWAIRWRRAWTAWEDAAKEPA